MVPMSRRRVLTASVLLCAGGTAAIGGMLSPLAQAPARRIALDARKFEFAPKEIRVKQGERITLALTSPDFVHGFSLPDFNVRADGIPGKTVDVTFVADRAGKFIYLCDNFCGEDHDKMTGWLIVTGQ